VFVAGLAHASGMLAACRGEAVAGVEWFRRDASATDRGIDSGSPRPAWPSSAGCWSRIGEADEAAPGSAIAFVYAARHIIDGVTTAPYRLTTVAARLVGEPWTFGIGTDAPARQHLAAFLERRGLEPAAYEPIVTSTAANSHMVASPSRSTGSYLCSERQEPGFVPGGPSRTVGTYSSSWIRPSKVRLATMSRATSG